MRPDIRSLVPHSGAMVLLDRLVDADRHNLCAEVSINADTLFCDGAAVGAWVGIEYMAQAIAAHAGYLAHMRGEPVKVGFLLGSRRYECSEAEFPVGSVLHVHVHEELQGENGLGAFACRIEEASRPGQVLAQATVTMFQPRNVHDFVEGKEGAT